MLFLTKSNHSTRKSVIFEIFLRQKCFLPNLRLRVCLAMCLIFQQSEPSMLINRVLTEKKMCTMSLIQFELFLGRSSDMIFRAHVHR